METEKAVISNTIKNQQGFKTFTLRTQDLEIAVIPELGAKIVSLKNLRTGREWLWHPGPAPSLFRNQPGDDFSRSSLVGADECLPTIAPCAWRGRNLPDHGEAWSAPWYVDSEAWKNNTLRTTLDLPISPFRFERQIEVRDNVVLIDYTLTSRSRATERFLWAFHPLLRLVPGDQLVLPTSTRCLLNGEIWIDAVDSAVPPGGCAKAFAEEIREGHAGLINPETGDSLTFEWDPSENNTLGLWLTRGGWHGLHHFAIEPTNGSPDALSIAAQQDRCGTIAAGGSTNWSLTLRLEP